MPQQPRGINLTHHGDLTFTIHFTQRCGQNVLLQAVIFHPLLSRLITLIVFVVFDGDPHSVFQTPLTEADYRALEIDLKKKKNPACPHQAFRGHKTGRPNKAIQAIKGQSTIFAIWTGLEQFNHIYWSDYKGLSWLSAINPDLWVAS